MSLRVLIAERHEILRCGLRTVIDRQPGWDVVGEVADSGDLPGLLESAAPDLVVMADSSPKTGIAIERIRRASQAKVVVLCAHRSDGHCRQAVEAGAHGALPNSAGVAELLRAIEEVASGGTYLVTRQSAGANPAGQRSAVLDIPLTARERELVTHICDGATNKEIATAMTISVRTVETYRAGIKDKLGLRSTGELIRWAVRARLIDP